MSLQFLPAGTSDALTLTGISKRSFETDVSVGGSSKGGPPGYMSVPFHTKMARMKHLYKLTDNELVVGGAILSLKDDVLNIERIFVAPEYFRKGYGLFMMKQIEELFSNVKKFLLDTPDWNVRTNSLYKKLGYKELRRGKGLVYYVKSENE
jgi:ribosomal protein S18 acetylase RimI-like enzyme